MSKVYVIYSEEWTWTRSTYDTEILCVCVDEEVAHRKVIHMQTKEGHTDKKYVLEEVEFDDFIP